MRINTNILLQYCQKLFKCYNKSAALWSRPLYQYILGSLRSRRIFIISGWVIHLFIFLFLSRGDGKWYTKVIYRPAVGWVRKSLFVTEVFHGRKDKKDRALALTVGSHLRWDVCVAKAFAPSRISRSARALQEVRIRKLPWSFKEGFGKSHCGVSWTLTEEGLNKAFSFFGKAFSYRLHIFLQANKLPATF